MTKNIFREEGLRGFYKGVKASLVSNPMFYCIYFPVYEQNKQFLGKRLSERGINSDTLVFSLSAASASILADLVVTPLWVVRIRYQTLFLYNKGSHAESFNLFREMNQIRRKEGFSALYKGLSISVLSSYQLVIQFNVYEQSKRNLANLFDCPVGQLDFRLIAVASMFSKGALLSSRIFRICLS